MGNCLRHESEMHWAGEDWDDFITQEEEEEDDDHIHRSKRMIVKQDCKSSDPSHEIVKIRLTKKQLLDLLSQTNVHDSTFRKQKSFLVDHGFQEEANQQRFWRPVLQSIPEVD